ncbi:MAG: hypothetical protein SNJ70_11285 [Armatimonadota bacterium]
MGYSYALINNGYYGVTGILRCIPNPGNAPVRLLIPRYLTDLKYYPESTGP